MTHGAKIPTQLLAETREPRVGKGNTAHDARTACFAFPNGAFPSRDLTSLIGSQWWKEERPVPLRKTGLLQTLASRD